MPARYVLLATVLLAAAATPARALTWAAAGGSRKCEPPSVFYSAAHDPTVATPCCPRPVQRCPGGVACVNGLCAPPYGTFACTTAPLDAPNIVLSIADDQAYCAFGFMGPACRTPGSGTAIPVPATPNLDALALQPANQGRGRYFLVAHEGASICNPAREVIELGNHQKDNRDPSVTKQAIGLRLQKPDGAMYCSMGAGGKFGVPGAAKTAGFNVWTDSRNVGRNLCTPAPCAPNCDEAPRCGADTPGGDGAAQREIFNFIDQLVVKPAGGQPYQAQPFFLWYGSNLPHSPHNSPVVLEDRTHPPVPSDYLFGPSFTHPGQPRFPFGAPQYRPIWIGREPQLPGDYGMIWWDDDRVHQMRQKLETVQVLKPDGTGLQSMWQNTVLIHVADNGADLPNAKRGFTENGYRTAMVIYDGRLPADGSVDTRIERELAHEIDILPTVLDYSGRSPAGVSGHSLKPYLSPTPPASPIRNTMCGGEATSYSGTPRRGRYIITRPGAVGRCGSPSGAACTTDAQCPGATTCLEGHCGSGRLCMENGDCPAIEQCLFKEQKWCRFGHRPLTESGVPPPDQQPNVACTADADCAANCPSADPLNCTCEYRQVKLYVQENGQRIMTDLFVDHDEPALNRKFAHGGGQLPATVDITPGSPNTALGSRLQCCVDRWWLPPSIGGNPQCNTCEPQYACHRCGDGVIDADEQCDGTLLGGKSCQSLGYPSGSLACSASCTLDTSGCSN